MSDQYADQRAHNVFWMTAEERNAINDRADRARDDYHDRENHSGTSGWIMCPICRSLFDN